MKTLLRWTLFSMAMSGMLYAEETYIPPKHVKIMFHLDKLPCEKGMLKKLSKNLTILAKREHNGSQKEHRLTAQLLMLSMRLDRNNESAVELNNLLINGGSLPISDINAKRKSMNDLDRDLNQLNKITDSNDVKALCAYLNDVSVALDKNSDLSKSHKEDLGRWSGIVPEVVEKPVINNTKPDVVSSIPDITEIPDTPSLDNPESVRPSHYSWIEHESDIWMALQFVKKNEENKYRTHFKMTKLTTRIVPRAEIKSEVKLEIKPWVDELALSAFKGHVDKIMKNIFEKFENLKIIISTTGKLTHRNRNRISFPLSLQLLASHKKIKLHERLAVLGHLSGNKLRRQYHFWSDLKYFRHQAKGRFRLIVPSSAAPDFKQLIILKEGSFFVRNEVLMAASLEEAVQLAGESENSLIIEAAKEFKEIQEKIGTKSLATYVSNKSIRRKLKVIVSKNPNHLSAKMLLFRGEAKRRRKLDKYYVADELYSILHQVSYVNNRETEHIRSHHLNRVSEKIDLKIKELNPFISSKDSSLPINLMNIQDDLKLIAKYRMKQREYERDGKKPSKKIEIKLDKAIEKFKEHYAKTKSLYFKAMSKLPRLE